MSTLQGEVISKAGLAAPGMILLVGGLVTIAFNGQAASSRRTKEAEAEQGIHKHACSPGYEESP